MECHGMAWHGVSPKTSEKQVLREGMDGWMDGWMEEIGLTGMDIL